MKLDTRLHAFREDLADERLRGRVDARRFTKGTLRAATARVLDLHAAPDADTGILAQAVFGETLRVFDERDGFAWVARERDGYVGYAASDGVGERAEPTHMVVAQRTFPYRDADLKSPRRYPLSMGSLVAVSGASETRGTAYRKTSEGWIVASHLAALETLGGDYVSHAARLLHVPYLWGGDSGFGVDCSGLVSLAMRLAGRDVVRDSDMQAEKLGTAIDGGDLRRGDLVFWHGHVGIMENEETLLHANGHTMSVAREPYGQAVERIAYLYGEPTGFRRP